MSSFLASLKKIGVFQCLFILFFFIDFVGIGHIFGYLLLAFFVIHKNILKATIDTDAIVLFLFSMVYALYYALNPAMGSQFILIYLVFPTSFYLFGKYIGATVGNLNKLYYVILGLGIIFSLLAILSVTYDIASNGFVQTSRNVSKLWGGDPINATGMAAYLFANMCIPALLIFSKPAKKKLFFLAMIGIYILSVVCVLRLGSRTQLGITLISLIVSILYKMSTLSPIKNIVLFAALFVGINFGFNALSIDKDSDLMSSYATRMDSKKYGAATAGGRTERWEKSLINLLEEPLGWKVEDFGYSHNMWFDAARVGGTIAFVLLAFFSVKSLINVKRLMFTASIGKEFKNLVLLFSIAFILQFLVEPILDGSYYLFVFFCLFQGIVNITVKRENTAAIVQ